MIRPFFKGEYGKQRNPHSRCAKSPTIMNVLTLQYNILQLQCVGVVTGCLYPLVRLVLPWPVVSITQGIYGTGARWNIGCNLSCMAGLFWNLW